MMLCAHVQHQITYLISTALKGEADFAGLGDPDVCYGTEE